MQIHLLASGSDGNSALVVSGNTAIMIDAGLGPRQLAQRLRKLDMDVSDIRACFLTHEHSDHIGGMRRKSFPHIPLFANAETAQAAQWELPEAQAQEWQIQPLGCVCQVEGLAIESISVSHDAASSVAYRISDGQQTLLYATDLGVPSEPLKAAIAEADYVVIESNHDELLLQTGPYPYYLKRRVAGKQGHLSNNQAASLLVASLSARTQWLALAHLSRTNNRPHVALKTVSDALVTRLGLHPDLRIVAAPSLASAAPPLSSD